MDVPEVEYARSGDVHVAYQSWGSGPDLVSVPPMVQNIEKCWDDPPGIAADWLRRLGRYCSVTQFDKRGTGLSDRGAGIAGIEERIDDIRAVMDARGIERAFIYGASEGGPMAILFAATYPERVAGLVLCGAAARFREAEDFPAGSPAHLIDRLTARLVRDWGTTESIFCRVWMPSLAGDPDFREWIRHYERACASPGAVRDLMRYIREVDVREAADALNVPTLVIHRTQDRVVPIAYGRDLAARIAGAKLVELPGEDHVSFVGPDMGEPIIAAIAEFVTGDAQPAPRAADRVLATVLFTDIVDSTLHAARLGDQAWRDLLDRHDAMVRGVLARHGGEEIKTTGDGFLATFDSPSRAVRAAASIRESAGNIGLEVRAGIHTGEIERRGSDVAGIAVHVGARISALAAPSEVLVSSTVRDLVLGSPFSFGDRGRRALKGIDGEWPILALESQGSA